MKTIAQWDEDEERHFDYPPDMRPLLLWFLALMVVGVLLLTVVKVSNRRVDAELRRIERTAR